MKLSFIISLALPIATSAFSSPSIGFHQPSPLVSPRANNNGPSKTAEPSPETITTAPWRVVLDIGREPLAAMPFDWARTGCRLPLVIPCDVRSDNTVMPKTETVSFTAQDGAVIRPIEGGEWKLSDDKKHLTLSLTFPEYMERRDVYVEAGTSVTLTSRVYTKDELDDLNQQFYDARDEAWALGEELNDIAKIQNGPKQWNEEKQVWEKQTDGIPSVFAQAQKRMKHMAAQTIQNQKRDQRPNLNTLSERGTFPGVESDVYVQKQGTIRMDTGKKAVMGTWSAEPLSESQASYYTQR